MATISMDDVVGVEDAATTGPEVKNRIPVSEVVGVSDSKQGKFIPISEVETHTPDNTSALAQISRGSKALSEDASFDPTAFYIQNEDALAYEPQAINTLAEVYRDKKLSASGIAKAALKTGAETVISAPRIVKKAAEAGIQLAKEGALIQARPGGIFGDASPATKKTVSELVNAAELNTANYAKLGTQLVDKVQDIRAADKTGIGEFLTGSKPKAPELSDWRERLLASAEFSRSAKNAEEGKGKFAYYFYASPEDLEKQGVKVDPKNIQDLSWVSDPLLLTGAGAGFKVATAEGKIVAEAATKTAGEAFIQSAKEAVQKAAATSLEKFGQQATKAGEALGSPAGRVASAAGGYAVGGGPAGLIAPETLKVVGKGAQVASEFVSGARKLPSFVTKPASVLGELASAPIDALKNPVPLGLASGARSDEEAGGVLGSVGAFSVIGKAAGLAKKGATSAAKAGAEQLAFKRFSEVDRNPVAPFDYGSDSVLDQAHKEALSALQQSDPKSANRLNFFRAVLPDKAELYLLPPDQFSKQVASALGVEGNFTEPGFVHRMPDGKVRVYLNQNATALGHEVGHAVELLMPSSEREAFKQSILDAYTPEQIQEFGAYYDSLLTGESSKPQQLGVNQDRIVNEMMAEVLSKALNAEKLDGVPPTVGTIATKFLTRLAEDVGLYEPGVGKTKEEGGSDLGVKPSAKAADAGIAGVEPNVGRLLKQTALAEPLPGDAPPVIQPATATPTPTTAPKKNLRVTPTEQAGGDVVKDISGASEAEAAIKNNPTLYKPEHAKVFSDVNAVLQRPQGEVAPIRIDYESVKSEGTGNEAKLRKAEQAEAYEKEQTLAQIPEDLRESVDKLTIPYRWTTRKGKNGKPDNVNLLAVSVDKVLSNARKIVELAKDNPEAAQLVSERYDSKDGKLTEAGWRQFISDFQAFGRNQANGLAGDGSKIVRPPGYTGLIPPENQTYRPTMLPKPQADFINAALGIVPPETNKTPPGFGGRPAEVFPNVQAAKLAEASGRPVIRPAATARPGKEVYTQGGADIPVAELNPFRDAMARTGIDLTKNNLFQATEELNLQNIKSVKSEPQSGFRAISTDASRAGFMPRAERAHFMPDTSKAKVADEVVRKIASEYNEKNKVGKTLFKGYEPIREDRAKAIADAYGKAEDAAESPEVKDAYSALAAEVKGQWDAIKDAGFKLEPWAKEGQPYKNSAEMAADVKENKRLYFFPTEEGFGASKPGEFENANPMLDESGVKVNGKPLLVNDLFRAVHDFFGHAKEGYEFGPRGEYNAYLAHSRMFSDPAVRALASETLGQNSWVNFGEHLRRPDGSLPERGDSDYVKPQDRPFAEQKAFLFPDELIKEATPGFGNTDASFMPTMAEYEARKAAPKPVIRALPQKPTGSPAGTIQLQRKEALPDSVGEPLRLIRYSSRPNEKVADPANFGKGAATSIDKRGDNKTFWFLEGSKTGGDSAIVATPGKDVYGARVDGKSIYDSLGDDPLEWASKVNRTVADGDVKRAGYSGVKTKSADGRDVVLLFEPVNQVDLGRLKKPALKAVNPGDVRFMPRVEKFEKPIEDFGYDDENDGYFYHVTTKDRLPNIEKSGKLSPGKKGNFPGAAARLNSKGNVFVTEKRGVQFWIDRLSEQVEASRDLSEDQQGIDFLTVLKIPKSAVKNPKPDSALESGGKNRDYFTSEDIVLPED
jgi:hypothetical protein